MILRPPCCDTKAAEAPRAIEPQDEGIEALDGGIARLADHADVALAARPPGRQAAPGEGRPVGGEVGQCDLRSLGSVPETWVTLLARRVVEGGQTLRDAYAAFPRVRAFGKSIGS